MYSSGVQEVQIIAHLIRARIINTEQNEKYLQTVPHRSFLDLSVVYSLEIGEFKGE